MSQTRWTAAKGVIARNVGGEIVLVPLKVGVANFEHVFLLSQVGGFIWEQLDGSRDRAQLCRLVAERFAVPAERDVDADVDHFLSELAQRKLLVEIGAEAVAATS